FFALVMVQVFVTETSGMWETNENQIVEDKYTHKGLYFSNQFYVELSNGETDSVFKKEFETLEKGDVFQPFFPSKSLKDLLLIFIGTGLGFLIFIFPAYFFATGIFRKTKIFQK